MLKEALAYLADLAVKGVTPQLMDLPGNKRLLWVPGSEAQELEGNRTLRRDTVGNLSSFEAWIRAVGGDRDCDIWVRHDRIVAYVDPTEPHLVDSAKMPLNESEQLKTLRSWKTGVNQQTFVRQLRTTFAELYDEKLLPVFRVLDFKRGSMTSRDVSHRGESLGRSIEELAQSRNGAIPEKMRFNVPLWDFVSSPMAMIDMAIECDNVGERLILLPIGDAFTTAVQTAQLELCERLRAEFEDESGVRVFVGGDTGRE